MYPVVKMCDILAVSTSGYYKWLDTEAKRNELEAKREKIKKTIRKIFHQSHGVYGSPRIWDAMQKLGYKISEKTIARYMKEMGLRATPEQPFIVTTDSNHSNPIYPNLLDRQFHPDKPNQAWTTDVTYIWTSAGWLYLATVMELYSRKIIGWNMSERMTKELCLGALDRALASRQTSKELIHHSDRGSQYTSHDYIARLNEHDIQISMSRKGNCWDNACIESFYATIKKELVYRTKYNNREEAIRAVWQYIMSFYNERRSHSTLGYASPNDYERAYWNQEGKKAM